MDAEYEIDARGMLCPLPVLKARKALQGMREGAVLRLLATDPASLIDVPHFCAEGGHGLLSVTEAADGKTYVIRRGPFAQEP
jgi:tRNA 2-thiouridine synthesizing protein A